MVEAALMSETLIKPKFFNTRNKDIINTRVNNTHVGLDAV